MKPGPLHHFPVATNSIQSHRPGGLPKYTKPCHVNLPANLNSTVKWAPENIHRDLAWNNQYSSILCSEPLISLSLSKCRRNREVASCMEAGRLSECLVYTLKATQIRSKQVPVFILIFSALAPAPFHFIWLSCAPTPLMSSFLLDLQRTYPHAGVWAYINPYVDSSW